MKISSTAAVLAGGLLIASAAFAVPPSSGEVQLGAPVDVEKGRQFWSFQPLRAVSPPQVRDTTWVRTPVDRFVRARQEAGGILPNEVADPRTLIRRAYFDLVGLPPSREEVEAFLQEAGRDLPTAYGRLVDRLLDSPHFGERWGRYWLDLARFAESNGYAFDKDRANAFQYRDFVIRAINADLPYDRFVRWQVAGDLLAPSDLDAVAATGFLVAGPFTTQQTQKERERSRYEQLDDMVHTMGTAMLGLTLGCARCHEHKYDPVPQSDYYRLAACFAEVGFSDVGLDLHPEVFRKAKAAFDAEHALLVAARTSYEKKQLPRRFSTWLAERPDDIPAPQIGVWHHVGPFAAGSFDEAYDKAFAPESETDLETTFQEGKLKWTAQPTWEDGKVHNTLSGSNAANYLFRVIESPAAQKVALSLGSDDAIRVWVNGTEVLANKVARGAAADQEKVDLPLKKGRNELLMKVVNGGGPSGFYFQSAVDGPSAKVEALLKTPMETWDEKQRATVLDWYKTVDERWLELNAAVEEHEKKAPKPDLTMIYAAKVRGSTYNFGSDTYKVYFLSRGNADNKVGEAPPGFLDVLMTADDGATAWLERNGSEGSPAPARVALAQWLTDVERGAGALLARVIVNRLWHHHFGRGIVATPSDFGTRGERPSHPDLLEWLAGELVRGGWRLKPLHRLIMTSAVYMQSGANTASGTERDPENLMLWRREPRRLEAEVVRDALLAVGGRLDTSMFGPGTLDARKPRRSVYLTVKRSRLIPILQLFDAPDAMQGIGKREQSTVAPQALAMMNSPMVREIAAALADRVRAEAGTNVEAAVDAAYRIALARPPAREELARMTAFVQRQTAARGSNGGAAELALRDFCHVLLCMNEFIFVD